MHLCFVVLICSTAVLDPGGAEAPLHGPLFGEDAWKGHLDGGFEKFVIYKDFSFLVSYILSRNYQLWLNVMAVFVSFRITKG